MCTLEMSSVSFLLCGLVVGLFTFLHGSRQTRIVKSGHFATKADAAWYTIDEFSNLYTSSEPALRLP